MTRNYKLTISDFKSIVHDEYYNVVPYYWLMSYIGFLISGTTMLIMKDFIKSLELNFFSLMGILISSSQVISGIIFIIFLNIFVWSSVKSTIHYYNNVEK